MGDQGISAIGDGAREWGARLAARAWPRRASNDREVAALAVRHVAGVFLMTLASSLPFGMPARIATVVFAAVALLPGRGLRKASRDGETRPAVVRAARAMGITGLASMALALATALPDAVGFAGFVLAYFSAGQLVFAWRAAKGPRHRAPVALGGGLALALVGLAIVLVAEAPIGFGAIALGIAVVPVGIALATEDTHGHRRRCQGDVAPLGAVVIVTGVALGSWLGASTTPLLVGALLLAVLVAAITSNTTLDITLLVLAGALVWAFLPTDVRDRGTVEPRPGDQVLIALGDSYISGEGASRYYRGTNVRGTNECRRSPDAHPVLLAPEGGRVLFAACSGAVGRDVHGAPRSGDLDTAVADPAGYARAWGSQVDFVRAVATELELEPTAILVSVGGNDAGFARIGVTCGLPGTCSQLGQAWLDDLAAVDAVLHDTYAGIAELAADLGGVPVVVVPYPVPLAEVGCDGSLLTDDEHRFLAGFTRQLNRVVQRNARAWGFEVATDAAGVLAERGLRICDGPARRAGINAIAANPVTGAFIEQLSPLTWFRNSFHPNARGHEALRDAVAPAIDAAVRRPGPPPPAPPAGTTTELATLEELLGDDAAHCGRADRRPTSCRSTDSAWIVAQLGRALLRATLPAALIATGAWIATVGLLDRRRAYRRRARD